VTAGVKSGAKDIQLKTSVAVGVVPRFMEESTPVIIRDFSIELLMKDPVSAKTAVYHSDVKETNGAFAVTRVDDAQAFTGTKKARRIQRRRDRRVRRATRLSGIQARLTNVNKQIQDAMLAKAQGRKPVVSVKLLQKQKKALEKRMKKQKAQDKRKQKQHKKRRTKRRSRRQLRRAKQAAKIRSKEYKKAKARLTKKQNKSKKAAKQTLKALKKSKKHADKRLKTIAKDLGKPISQKKRRRLPRNPKSRRNLKNKSRRAKRKLRNPKNC
jgi:hypothetical protein